MQFVNTLSVEDGGPSRNSFELNLALNAVLAEPTRLVWIRGRRKDSVLYGERLPRLPRPPARLLGGLRRSINGLRESGNCRAWIVHGYYLWWIPFVCMAARISRTPVFLVPHGTFTAHQRRFSTRKKAIFDSVFGGFVRESVAAALVGSGSEQRELLGLGTFKEVVVAGVGTRVEPLARGHRWGNPLTILALGRIAQKKRIDLAIATVDELRGRGFPCRLEIVGEGDEAYVESLRRATSESGLSDHVVFAGGATGASKLSHLASADILLSPSDDENFGIAVAEALASGLPVVVSHAVASANGLPFGAGRVVTLPTPVSLADAVVDLALSDKEAACLAAADFATRFSWSAVARTWDQTLGRYVPNWQTVS